MLQSKLNYYITSQSHSYLLHVLGDGVLSEELGALPRVVALSVLQEGGLKVFLVHPQGGALTGGVILIQPQLHCK